VGFGIARTLYRTLRPTFFSAPQPHPAPLPCWLAVHREVRGSGLVRRVFDFLAEAIPREPAIAA
jgi:hypothetical protein